MTRHTHRNGAYTKITPRSTESHTCSPCPRETFTPNSVGSAVIGGSMDLNSHLAFRQSPFGLTGAPTTFTHVTAEKLGDMLPKLNIELLVDDGGMAGDCFEDVLDRTRQFFTRCQCANMLCTWVIRSKQILMGLSGRLR
jgi:hypothetical protein